MRKTSEIVIPFITAAVEAAPRIEWAVKGFPTIELWTPELLLLSNVRSLTWTPVEKV